MKALCETEPRRNPLSESKVVANIALDSPHSILKSATAYTFVAVGLLNEQYSGTYAYFPGKLKYILIKLTGIIQFE